VFGLGHHSSLAGPTIPRLIAQLGEDASRLLRCLVLDAGLFSLFGDHFQQPRVLASPKM
jgi:hypothetical protein